MKLAIFAWAALIGLAVPVKGQTLGEVLSSLQERKRVVEQSKQVGQYVVTLVPDSSPPGVSAQALIEWKDATETGPGIAPFPTDGELASLSIDERVGLVNKAVAEFGKLSGSFLNLRGQDLLAGSKVALRPYLREDFAPLGRADEKNYQQVLHALARDIRRLRVMPWIGAGKFYEQRLWVDKYETVTEFNPDGPPDIETRYAEGSAAVSGWTPGSLSGGAVDPADLGRWEIRGDFKNASTFLEEVVSVGGHYQVGEYEEDDETYELQFLECSKYVKYFAEMAIYPSVPGRSDQVTGKVGLLYQNAWTPADPGGYEAPSEWDKGDAGWKIAVVRTGGGSTYPLDSSGGPDIEVDLNWIAGPNGQRAVASGFNNLAACIPGTDFTQFFESWESDFGGDSSQTILKRRWLQVFVPEFEKGLDAGSAPAAMELAEKSASVPAGDAAVQLHPRPGILVGAPIGVGLGGASEGWIGVSPTLTRFQYGSPSDYLSGSHSGIIYPGYTHIDPVVMRFDYSSNLRFIGSAEDFHVVYATGRDSSSRGSSLTARKPTSAEAYENGWPRNDNSSFFTAWDLPRLRQVVGREMIADITVSGHLRSTVKIYRRPAGAPLPNRAPGQLADLAGSVLVRTLTFDHAAMAGNPYAIMDQKIEVTDGSAEYTVTNDGFGHDDVPATFVAKESGHELYRKEVTFPGSAIAGLITEWVDGIASKTTELEGVAGFGGQWAWWDYKPSPGKITVTAAGLDTVYTPTLVAAAPYPSGTQEGRYPTALQIDYPDRPDNPDVSFVWEPGGVLKSASSGPWNYTAVVSGNVVTGTSKLGPGTISTTWTEFFDDGRRIRSYSAPDAGAGSRTAASVDWTEIEYGSTSTGLPGFPHIGRRKDGTGTTYGWSVGSDGAYTLQVDDGLMPSSSVTRGTRTSTSVNARGYAIARDSYLVLGSTLKMTGSSTPSGQFTAWGAPTKALDYKTGLQASWSYDGAKERLASYTDTLGVTTSYGTYDAIDRLKSYTWDGNAGSLSYNTSGFGISSSLAIPGRPHSSSSSWDAMGRPTSGSSTAGGTRSWSVSRATDTETVSLADSATTASTSITTRKADGTLATASGNTLPFSGTTGDGLAVDGGLLKSQQAVTGLSGSFQTVWTDAWGRVRKVATPSTAGTGADETLYSYSDPGDAVKRTFVQDAAGRKKISEIDAWNSSGKIDRSGIDMNGNGSLDGTDRFVTKVTSISSGKLLSVVSQMEDSGARELMRTEYNPNGNVVTTTVNGNEESVTTQPNYSAKTITTTSSKGWTRTVSLNNRWKAETATMSGTGMPTATFDPSWRADGTLSAVNWTLAGQTSSASFTNDGRLSGLSDPELGSIFGSHSFASGSESVVIDGTTRTGKLDGTQTSVSGGDVMARTTTLAVSGTEFTETIAPATGSSTTLRYNPSGAKERHDYAAGFKPDPAWYAGGLLKSLANARGTVNYSYTGGAKDLTSVEWPSVTPTNFSAIEGVTHTFGHDRAGRVNAVTDESGSRAISYEKDRLKEVDYTAGALNPYRVVRSYDTAGRQNGLTVYRDGVQIHDIDYGYNSSSSELADVSSGSFAATFGRDTGRRLTSVTRGTTVQSWTRAGTGRITAAAATGVAGSLSYGYNTFDSKGRRKDNVTGGSTWSYNYGTAGQLTSASHPTYGSFAYSVDGIGRRDGSTDALNRAVTRTTPASQKLFISAHTGSRVWLNGGEITPFGGLYAATISTPGSSGGWVPWSVLAVRTGAGSPGAGADARAMAQGAIWFPPATESFSHDTDGNRESTSLMEYGWDSQNQLTFARTKSLSTAPEAWDLDFSYDAEGRRHRKHVKHYREGALVSEKTVTYVWDGWDLAYERHEAPGGAFLYDRSYVWGPDISGTRGGAGGAGGLTLIREKRGTTTTDYYPFYDGAGHLTGLSDGTGALAAQYVYGPFGESVSLSGSAAQANPWRYATKYLDEETGLYYFGKRYYDPATGTWLSREPLGEDESINLYAYCHNDPINNVDILGLGEAEVQGHISDAIVQRDILYKALAGLAGLSNEEVASRTDRIEQLYGNYLSSINAGYKELGQFMDDGTLLSFRSADDDLVTSISALPLSIAGINPSRSQYAELRAAGVPIAASLESQISILDNTHTALVVTETTGTAISLCTGVGGLGVGITKVAVAQGGKAAAKFAAIQLGKAGAGLAGGYLAEHGLIAAGVAPEKAQLVMKGAELFFAVKMLKAARLAGGAPSTIPEAEVNLPVTANSVSKLDGIPLTGVAKYDQLVVESKYFDSFIRGVKSRGFRISSNPNLWERASLRLGRNKMIFEYNPKTFNVLDMRHEIKHFNQFKQYGRSMYNNTPAMEREAYGFELDLGGKIGFSADYMEWARGRYVDYGGSRVDFGGY